MLQINKNKLRITALLALFFLVFAGAASATEGKWIHIKVEGHDDEQVTVNLPLSLVTAASAMIPDDVRAEIDHETRVALDDLEMSWADLRTFWNELKNAPEATFVTVQTKDENIEVKKEGNFILVNSPNADGGKTEINVKFPMAVVDALLSGPEGTLNFEAAINELANYDGDNLVSVRDGDETVRIWIDNKNEAD